MTARARTQTVSHPRRCRNDLRFAVSSSCPPTAAPPDILLSLSITGEERKTQRPSYQAEPRSSGPAKPVVSTLWDTAFPKTPMFRYSGRLRQEARKFETSLVNLERPYLKTKDKNGAWMCLRVKVLGSISSTTPPKPVMLKD